MCSCNFELHDIYSVSLLKTELPDFLTPDECEHIMEMADAQGLMSSGLHIDELTRKNKYQIHGNNSYHVFIYHTYM